jgi:hypothetical protein
MDGSGGSNCLHVWSVHRSCGVGQHGRQVCRQPITIAGLEMVTIPSSINFKQVKLSRIGARSSIVVKALCYKPEGRGFETR